MTEELCPFSEFICIIYWSLLKSCVPLVRSHMIFGKEGIYTMREQIQKEKWSLMNSVDV